MKYIATSIAVAFSILCYSQELYFPPLTGETWERLSLDELGWCEDKLPALENFISDSNSKSLLILKDGKLAVEMYTNDHAADSVWYWASAGKSLTSFLVGVAQTDGDLDINDKTSDYLGSGWTSCSVTDENMITIKSQLSMSTGLDYDTDNIDCTDTECLDCLQEPFDEWYYHNGPYTLLGDVVESATGMSYNLYMFRKLSLVTGIVGLWTDLSYNRVFFSTSRNMARFGLLMLGGGAWDGEQLIDEDYFDSMIVSSQEDNPSYGYLWWLNSGESYKIPSLRLSFDGKLIPDAPDDTYAAIGKDGQIITVIPSEGLVIVRTGDNPDQSLVPVNYVRDLWSEVQKLQCATAVQDFASNVSINLQGNHLLVESEMEIQQILIYGVGGNVVLSRSFDGYSTVNNVDTSEFQSGMYVIQVVIDDQLSNHKIVIY